MSSTLKVFIGVMIPFVGTSLGAGTVFFLKNMVKPWLHQLLMGFASGVMIAASVWSLLLPAIDMAESAGNIAWFPAVTGFLFGIFFLLLLDRLVPHLHASADAPEGVKSSLGKQTMLALAVTLHNIPEGMAVGILFAGVLAGGMELSFAAAFVLAIGIALQNIPEGAIISLPLAEGGMRRTKAFGYGVVSGAVEPIGAVLTILLTQLVAPALPYILSFAAGAMIYVVAEELIPESKGGIGTIGVAVGFALMMVLDVALG